MKKISISILALLFIGIGLKAQVWEGNYNIRTQEDIDSFQRNCKCTEIEGSLNINGSSIDNLLGLSDLYEVQGDLSIFNTNDLINLNGLANLRSVGRNLTISRNSRLKNVNHLSNLKTLGASLTIQVNSRLTDLNGLANIESTSLDQINIYDNNQLTNINILNNLKILNNSFQVNGNEQLSTIKGFDNLKEVGGNFFISNSKIADVSAFKNLSSVRFTFTMLDNRLLKQINLPELNNINTLIFSNNDVLNQISLPKLTSISNSFTLRGNFQLVDLDGLLSLNHIGGQLVLESNISLTSIEGLQNIVTIGGNLFLTENFALTECCILSCKIRDRVIGGGINIQNNAEGCFNATQLYLGCQDFCTITDVHENPKEQLLLSFLPAQNYLQINLPKDMANKSQWKIIDMNGKVKAQGNINHFSPTLTIALTNLSQGLYVLQLQNEAQKYTGKFIK